MADGDVLKWNAVTSLPVGMAFLKMTLDKDKNEAIENDRRIQERASGVN